MRSMIKNGMILGENKLSDILNSDIFKKYERFVDSPFCLHKCGKGNQT